jgi:hypothetical protein
MDSEPLFKTQAAPPQVRASSRSEVNLKKAAPPSLEQAVS